MPTMNISLPEAMKEFVEGEVADGGYSTVSEYVRQLIRDAQERKATQRLEALLLAGLDSGPVVEMTQDDWEDVRRQAFRRLAERTRA